MMRFFSDFIYDSKSRVFISTGVRGSFGSGAGLLVS